MPWVQTITSEPAAKYIVLSELGLVYPTRGIGSNSGRLESEGLESCIVGTQFCFLCETCPFVDIRGPVNVVGNCPLGLHVR